MTHPKPRTLFFAGTDTDVGKTFVASLAARVFSAAGKKVGVYKPVASGCRLDNGELVADDALSLWNAAGKPRALHDVCPQRFREPLAPPEAAAAEGKQVDPRQLVDGYRCWEDNFDVVIVEGAGGLFSPLADGMLNVDLAAKLSAPVVIVAANRLGVIHQTLAVCEAAANRGLKPIGVVLCDTTGQADASSTSNAAQIERYCPIPVIGSIPFAANVDEARFLDSLLA
ncbi:MAG: dethiobiotin synthase [Rubripirellula sp.]